MLVSKTRKGALVSFSAQNEDGHRFCVALMTNDAADRLKKWTDDQEVMMETAAENAGIKFSSYKQSSE
jgi:hypothetical protein